MTQSKTINADLPRSVPSPWSAYLDALTRTNSAWPQSVARVVLGLVILPHGLQKTIGALGGYGFSATLDFLTTQAGLPWIVALAVIAIESIGAAALIAGAGTRVWAAGVAAVMVGAVATQHWQHGFFMNWFGAQAGEGFEFHLLALGLAAVAVLGGGGNFSVDRWLHTRRSRR